MQGIWCATICNSSNVTTIVVHDMCFKTVLWLNTMQKVFIADTLSVLWILLLQ